MLKNRRKIRYRIIKLRSDEHCCERGIAFLQWLNKRPEKCIAVVTHSSFLRHIFSQFGGNLHEDDRVMDPIAWRLGFGAIVVFNIFKNLQIAMTLTEWFAIWLGCMVILCLGHFYGAVRMFLWLYAQVFPCFRGYEDDAEGFQMCYRGQILIGHTAATLFLAGSCFFLWLWRNHTIASLKRRGLYEQSLDLDGIDHHEYRINPSYDQELKDLAEKKADVCLNPKP